MLACAPKGLPYSNSHITSPELTDSAFLDNLDYVWMIVPYKPETQDSSVPVFSLRKGENTFSAPHFSFWKPTAYCELSVIVFTLIQHNARFWTEQSRTALLQRYCTAELQSIQVIHGKQKLGYLTHFCSNRCNSFPPGPIHTKQQQQH